MIFSALVDKLTRSFYYSYDGQDWQTVGVLENCIYLCDEGVPDDPKRHTGTLVGAPSHPESPPSVPPHGCG